MVLVLGVASNLVMVHQTYKCGLRRNGSGIHRTPRQAVLLCGTACEEERDPAGIMLLLVTTGAQKNCNNACLPVPYLLAAPIKTEQRSRRSQTL